MTTFNSITWESEFLGIVSLSGTDLVPNKYKIKLTMTCCTEDMHEQNIAFDRIKFFIEKIVNNSIICLDSDPCISWMTSNLDIPRILTLPAEPYDQVLSIALLLKLNKITNEHIIIEQINLSSYHGDDIDYTTDLDTDTTLFSKQTLGDIFDESDFFIEDVKDWKRWWLRDDLATTDEVMVDDKNEIIIFAGWASWEDLQLTWEKNISENQINTKPKGFNPTVIDGGRND